MVLSSFSHAAPPEEDASPVSPSQPAVGEPNFSDDYRLDSGDHLRIKFYDRYDRDDLNGEYVIGGSGGLRLPRIGSFNVRDMTTAEVERSVRAEIARRGEKPARRGAICTSVTGPTRPPTTASTAGARRASGTA